MGSGENKPLCILYLPVCGCVPSSLQHCSQTPFPCDSGCLVFWSCWSFLSHSRWLNVGTTNPHSNKQPFSQKKLLCCPHLPCVWWHQQCLFPWLMLHCSFCQPRVVLLPKRDPRAQSLGWGLSVFPFYIIKCIHGTLWVLTATTQPHPFTERACPEPRQKIMGL